VQRLIAPQYGGMSEAPGAHQYGDQKSQEGGRRIDLIGGLPPHWHVLAKLSHQIDLLEEGNEDGHSTEGRDRPFGLAQDQPFAGQQSGDFPRNRFIRGLSLHSSVVSDLTRRPQLNFGIQD
jgi:hypothetical protein